MIEKVGTSSGKVVEKTNGLVGIIQNLSSRAEENAATTEETSASVDTGTIDPRHIKSIRKPSRDCYKTSRRSV